MLLKVIVVFQQSCLVLCSCQASDALLITNGVGDMIGQILESGILADLLKLLGLLNNAFSFREKTELSDALIRNRFLWEVSRMLDTG